MIYVYFFIKSVVKWSENCEIRIFYGKSLVDGPNSVRFYLSVRYGMYVHLINGYCRILYTPDSPELTV